MAETVASTDVPTGSGKRALAVLFFLHAAAMAAYTVPLANVLKAYGISDAAITLAFCTGGVAAFISPMMAGSLADRRVPPERLLAALCAASACFLFLTFHAIEQRWGTSWVLGCMMAYALTNAPGFGLLTSIVLSRLSDARREFGPLRAWATWGWMLSSVGISYGLHADRSPVSGYGAGGIFLLEAAFCLTLRPTYPAESREPRRWRDFFGWEALQLLRHPDHRIIFLTSAIFSAILSTFYRYSSAHLADLGNPSPSATMGLAQVLEGFAMLALAALLTRFRLKWVLLAGLMAGVLRLGLMATNIQGWLILSIALHGPVFVLFYPTSQIYLEQRVDHRLRAQSQALLSLLNSGVGNLSGYLLIGWWHTACTTSLGVVDWTRFWTPLALGTLALAGFFLLTYRGQHRPD
ncbi:MAG: MFS transporter [Verrucomicrobiota bacterium]